MEHQIPSVDLGPNDVLVAHVGVGQMPSHRVKDYLTEAKQNLKVVFGEQPILLLPVPDVKFTTFSVIHRQGPAPERKVYHVDIAENMSQEEIKRHLDNIRGSIRMDK